jgi:hypothetical protein
VVVTKVLRQSRGEGQRAPVERQVPLEKVKRGVYTLIAATFTRAHAGAASLAAVESTWPIPPSTQPSPSPPNPHLHRARLEPPPSPGRQFATLATAEPAALTTTSHLLICRREPTAALPAATAALAAAVLPTAALATTALATSALAITTRTTAARPIQISFISRRDLPDPSSCYYRRNVCYYVCYYEGCLIIARYYSYDRA